MAVRLDAATKYLTRTSGLFNYNSAYTIMAWIKLLSWPDGYLYIPFGDSNNYDSTFIGSDGILASEVVNGGAYDYVAGSTVLTTGVWYHVAMVRSSTANLTVYLNGSSEYSSTQNVSGRTAQATNYISYPDYPFDGDVAALKLWTTNLTASQILMEMYTTTAARYQNLHALWPLFPGTTERLRDYSGNGRNWSQNGTIVDQPGPPIVWILPPQTPGGIPVSGQTIAIGLATETETVHALTVVKTRALGLAAETETVQALKSTKVRPIGLASETDAALGPLVAVQAYSLGLATETETVHALTVVKTSSLGLVTETDAVHALTVVKTSSLGLATETETVQAVAVSKTRALGLVTETDTAQAVTVAGATAIGLATETETVHALTVVKTSSLGLVTETDAVHALTVVKTSSLGLVTETDAVHAVAVSKTRALGLVTETDAANAVTVAGATAIGLATETETVHALTVVKTSSLGLVTETDAANAVTVAGAAYILGLVTETDTVHALVAGIMQTHAPTLLSEEIKLFDSETMIVYYSEDNESLKGE